MCVARSWLIITLINFILKRNIEYRIYIIFIYYIYLARIAKDLARSPLSPNISFVVLCHSFSKRMEESFFFKKKLMFGTHMSFG